MAERAVPSSSFTYDVFLNFRGEDTRTSFVEFLYHSLKQRGIKAFIDDEGLKRGEEITPALLRAIQESRIAIVVFSENYASSTYCLKELAQIMECLRVEGRLVLPVFYEVDPSDVRHQGKSYGVYFAKLEEKFQHDNEKVQKWRAALTEAANLSGFPIKTGSSKHHFIQTIVEEVSKKINRVPLHVADHPVGLESQVLKITSLLELGNDKGVNMVGIYGIGGIGKSTIARAVYNLIADQFEDVCFLADIREKSTKDGLVKLQWTVLSELLEEKDINFSYVSRGISILKMRLRMKKVLLILDDVDKLNQLKAIAGGLDWFGPGSRVIITTRDKHLLAVHGVVKSYEVEELSQREALELFSWNAFKKSAVDSNCADLSNRALLYAHGLPLALEVIGSYLFDKKRDEWHSALDKYERIPNQELHEILKVSYDSLDEDVKEIFLDIACFFNGSEIKYVKEMLYVRNFHPEDGIRVLTDKSLAKLDADKVRMHDMIRDMGRNVVRQESISEPGNRSRLWLAEEIVHVLEENTGTDKIKVIMLKLLKYKEVQWSGEAFEKMKRLRILIIENARFSASPKHLPNSLRVLEWSEYPSPSLPSDFHPKELVILCLPESCLKNFEPLKMFESLSIMDFEGCKFLTEVPDLSGVPNLGSLCLDNCTNLIRVHESVGFVDKLISLTAKGCTQLLTLVPSIMLTSLETLDLGECSQLESFPEVVGRMDNVRKVYLDHTAIAKLPLSIGNLIGLERLFLRECKRLTQLPHSIKLLPKLEVLTAYGRRGFRLYEPYGDPEYVSSEVFSTMIVHDSLSTDGCFREACTAIISENFIQVCATGINDPMLSVVDHLSPGSSMSFWFRKQFPEITLTVLGPEVDMENSVVCFQLCLLINGAKQFITSCNHMFSSSRKSPHVFSCELLRKGEKLFLEHEWNLVEVSCELKYHRSYVDKLAIAGHHIGMVVGTIKGIGVCVRKENTSIEDVQFALPNRSDRTNNGTELQRSEELLDLHIYLDKLWTATRDGNLSPNLRIPARTFPFGLQIWRLFSGEDGD